MNEVNKAVAWQRRYAKLAPDGSRYEWHEISCEQYLEAAKGKWASAYELRELYTAPVAAAPAEFAISDGDRAVLQRLKCALPTAGVNGWAKGVEVLERILRTTVASTPAAPGIDLAALGDIAGELLASVTADEYRPNQIALIESICRRIDALIDASPKGGSDLHGYMLAASQVRRGYDVECDRCGKFCDEGQGPCVQATSAEVGA